MEGVDTGNRRKCVERGKRDMNGLAEDVEAMITCTNFSLISVQSMEIKMPITLACTHSRVYKDVSIVRFREISLHCCMIPSIMKWRFLSL